MKHEGDAPTCCMKALERHGKGIAQADGTFLVQPYHCKDGAALLASVLAAPEDDAPRLVYADWLDEHGEGERAEFIRVQMELARLKHPDKHYHWRGTADCDGCRAKKLRGRERALLDEHGLYWIPVVDGWCVHTWSMGPGQPLRFGMGKGPADGPTEQLRVEVVFARGFVAHVELTTAAFLGGPCGRCDVSPGIRRYPTHDGDWVEDECNECSGSGRTPGIAAALFSAQPVTEVRLSDREPNLDLGTPGVWWGDPADTNLDQANRLPWALFGCLEGGHLLGPSERSAARGSRLHDRIYGDHELAHAALSAGAVRYGRKLAGVG